MRIEKSLKNVAVAFVFQAVGILISFFSRQYFIMILGLDYLGLNGLFGNILSMLSLAELGFSTAMMFLLYKPIAEQKEHEIRLLMKFFKKIYLVVGLAIFVIGLLIIPFLQTFVESSYHLNEIIVYYIAYLAATSISYLFTYKSILLVAYQDKYLSTTITYSVFIVLNIGQIIVLYLTGSYLLYLILMLLFNLLEGILVNIIVNRRYPFIRIPVKENIQKSQKAEIVKNVKALFIHRVGGVVINGTDNLIIASFVSLSAVGYYSNYYLIINALNILIGQIFTGVTASVGNLGATDDKRRLYEVYLVGLYMNAFIYYTSTIIVWFLVQDFITIWVGPEYIMSSGVVIIILANFLVNGMRRITMVFRDSLGLYYYDRHKPLIESAINLVVSILLVKNFGLLGVFLGTLISMLTTSFWVEPYILYKYGFEQGLRDYILKYLRYFIIGAFGFLAIFLVNNLWMIKLSLMTLILKGCLFLLLLIGIFMIGTIKTDEFAELKYIVERMYKKYVKKSI